MSGRASAAALLTTLTVIVVVLIPSAVLVGAVGGQAFNLYKGITMGTVDIHAPIAYIERSIPALTDLLAGYGIDKFAEVARATMKGTLVVALVQGAIGMADNVLRPNLVSHETQMPDYLVLLSTLGGLAIFGLSGVVIGPFVAALFLVVWEMLTEEYAEPAPVFGPPNPVPV